MPTAIDHNFATVGVGQFLHTAAPAVGGAWSGAWIGDPTATFTINQWAHNVSACPVEYQATLASGDSLPPLMSFDSRTSPM